MRSLWALMVIIDMINQIMLLTGFRNEILVEWEGILWLDAIVDTFQYSLPSRDIIADSIESVST